MPPIWSGTLSFGLVAIPVRMQSIVSSHKIAFRQMHKADHGPVRQKKTCEIDQQVLDPQDIGRAYETPDGQLVEVTDDELAAMPLPTAKTIEVSGFLDASTVDYMQLDKPYALEPGPGGEKPYTLMQRALSRSGKAAVGKVAMNNRERLVLVHARDKVLIAQTLHWPDEMKPSAEAAPRGKVDLSDEEVDAAIALIEALGEADPADFEDEYAKAVTALVQAKIDGAQGPRAAAQQQPDGKVVDLMEALQASLAEAKKSRGGDATVHDITPAKKATSKKTAAKKTAASHASTSASHTRARSTPKGGEGKKSTSATKKATKKAPAKKATARKRSA
ncbi:non-homologous end joining protein Ku [Streptomyces sp. H39-S7]|uniref:non-homologous end joining protein Ku n=1 Tax=Streptomyces sp. H39-S7 TaxID=3004357 RepID=UPI0022AEFBF5|nr:Ku protein [Streptomyces sp. H39-S7]MCZ4124990.1 Ku protein [Streptomyces sp. H39-S7]